MLRLASDADVHGAIIDGLRRHQPGIDLVRAQDALPEGTPDHEVLIWAAAHNRILITNDRNTMVGLAYKRVADGEPVAPLIITSNKQSIGGAIEEILLVAECMPEEEIQKGKSCYIFPYADASVYRVYKSAQEYMAGLLLTTDE